MISPISMTNSVNFTGNVNRTVYDYNPNDPTMARMPRTIKKAKAETPKEPVKYYDSGDPSREIKVIRTKNGGILPVHPLNKESDWRDQYGVTGIPVVITTDNPSKDEYRIVSILTSPDQVKRTASALELFKNTGNARVGYIPALSPSQDTEIVDGITVADARKMLDPKYDRYSDIGAGRALLAQMSTRTNGEAPEGFRHSFNGDDVPDILTEKPNKRPAYSIKNPIESPCRYDNRELAQTYGRGSGNWHLNA